MTAATPTRQVTARLPVALVERLDGHRTRTGLSRTGQLCVALAAGLDDLDHQETRR